MNPKQDDIIIDGELLMGSNPIYENHTVSIDRINFVTKGPRDHGIFSISEDGTFFSLRKHLRITNCSECNTLRLSITDGVDWMDTYMGHRFSNRK